MRGSSDSNAWRRRVRLLREIEGRASTTDATSIRKHWHDAALLMRLELLWLRIILNIIEDAKTARER